MNANAIHLGLFDSGLGGLTVLRAITEQIPPARLSYIADAAFFPYGNRSSEEIIERSLILAQALIARGVEMVVVACNTATTHAISELRRSFPTMTFVGIEPYLKVVEKLANEGVARTQVGVLTTAQTAVSPKFIHLKRQVDPENHCFHYASRDLAKLIEAYIREPSVDQKLVIRDLILADLDILKDRALTHLILGCTHYPLIEDLIATHLQVRPLSPAPHVAARVGQLLRTRYGTMAFEQWCQQSAAPTHFDYSEDGKLWRPCRCDLGDFLG